MEQLLALATKSRPVEKTYEVMATPLPPGPHLEPPASASAPVRFRSDRRRALLVGINYAGSKAQLAGCIADVKNVKNMLVNTYAYPTSPDAMRVLTDAPENANDASRLPTKANMLAAMRWLVDGAKSGDSLFFHYSGHGNRVKDTDGDEEDGYDETLVPLDFERAGEIVDDEIHSILVKNLPEGVHLTCIFDCCHSGTALDLPFCYLSDGVTRHNKYALMELAKEAMGVHAKYRAGDTMGAIKGAMGLFSKLRSMGASDSEQSQSQSQPQATNNDASDAKRAERVRAKMSKANVRLISGCKDCQTSADAKIDNQPTGAMSWALLKSLETKPQQSYAQLLVSTRNLLQSKYSQIPQLSSGRQVDMNELFAL